MCFHTSGQLKITTAKSMTGGTDVCTGTYITVTVLGTLKARLHCRKTRHGSAGKVFGTTGAYGTGKIMARALKSWYVSFTRKKLPGPFQFLIRAVPSFCSAKERCDGTLIRTMTPKLYTSSMNELENWGKQVQPKNAVSNYLTENRLNIFRCGRGKLEKG